MQGWQRQYISVNASVQREVRSQSKYRKINYNNSKRLSIFTSRQENIVTVKVTKADPT